MMGSIRRQVDAETRTKIHFKIMGTPEDEEFNLKDFFAKIQQRLKTWSERTDRPKTPTFSPTGENTPPRPNGSGDADRSESIGSEPGTTTTPPGAAGGYNPFTDYGPNNTGSSNMPNQQGTQGPKEPSTRPKTQAKKKTTFNKSSIGVSTFLQDSPAESSDEVSDVGEPIGSSTRNGASARKIGEAERMKNLEEEQQRMMDLMKILREEVHVARKEVQVARKDAVQSLSTSVTNQEEAVRAREQLQAELQSMEQERNKAQSDRVNQIQQCL